MKILVVDDEMVGRTIIKKVLTQSMRAEVREAGSAEEAFRLMEDGFHPDLVISDVLMPGLGGAEFLGRLRADRRWSKMSVLICSSANNRQTVERLARLGVAGYLLKPISSKRLLDEVRKIERTCPPAAALEARDTVLRRLGLKEADYEELLDLFREECERQLKELAAAATAADVRHVRFLVHSLNGAAGNIGATLLSTAAERVMTELAAGATSDLEDLIEPVRFAGRRLLALLAEGESNGDPQPEGDSNAETKESEPVAAQ